MRKKYFRIVIFCVSLLLISGIWLLRQLNHPGVTTNNVKYSIFSWSSEEVTENREEFIEDLIDYEFSRVFQSFSSRLSQEEVISFLQAMSEQEIDVYSLAGTPEWAFDPNGTSMIRQLERVVEVNQQLSKEKQIKGLVIDVEPYTLDGFDWADLDIQKTFIAGVKKLYLASEEENLELIIVIPYFYDSKGYKEVTEAFIQEFSDEVAVMNYYRNREIKNLAYEARKAKKVNKPLTTVYELKRPGEHSLRDKNTYYHEGWSALLENVEQLIQHYQDQTINIAVHDYHAFRKVIQRE